MVKAATVITGGLHTYLQPGQTVIDVGANIGRLAVTYAEAVGPTGRVIACEPCPEALEKGRKSYERYPWIDVRQVAVCDTIGERQLYQGKLTEQCSLWLENVPKPKDVRVHTVQTTTLDAIGADLPFVHAIKIDAQGAEMAILAGATQTLQRPETVWMLEVWPEGLLQAGSSLSVLIETLRGAGLLVIAEGKDPRSYEGLTWEAVAKTRAGGHHHTNIVCMSKRRSS